MGEKMFDKIKTCKDKNEKYSFISYSHADAEKVYPILKELQINRYRIWYDHHIESGAKWADYIYEWLTNENCTKFIIFISKHSIESENVKDEVHLARKHHKSCLVIYLDDIQLTGGLELQLDRWQSIKWYENAENVSLKKLMKAIPVETIEMSTNINGAESDFQRKYQLLEVIGRGGTSTIYKAVMKETGAVVTVKVVDDDGGVIESVIRNEKNVLAKVNSPFIPKVIDYGKDYFIGKKCIYLVESYVRGENLSNIRCPLNEAEVVMIILGTARALLYLHEDGNNLVHTDIKPANIMIDRFNNINLIDFGSCVEAGTVVRWGTVSFAAPEQRNVMNVDVRSDIYSLGTTMKYLVVKDKLREAGITFSSVYSRSVMELNPNTSHILAFIINKMTEERMEYRFQSLEELIAMLEEYQQKQSARVEMILNKNQYYKDSMEIQRFIEAEDDSTTIGINEMEETVYPHMMEHTALLDLSVSLEGCYLPPFHSEKLN